MSVDPKHIVEINRQAKAMLAEMGESMPPPASDAEIEALENDYFDGKPIPPSYRDFLVLQNGWERCWRRFSLGGTETLRQGKLREDIDRVIDGYAATLGFADEDEDARRDHAEANETSPFGQICFGSNFEGDLLMFDLRRTDANGEMPVRMWNPDDGMISEWPSFEAMLREAVTDMLDRLRG